MQKTTRSICIIDALIQYFLSLLIAMAFGAAPMMANADTLPSLSKDSLCHASLSPPASVVFANPTFHPVANIWTTRAAVISALQDHNYALAAHNYRDLTGFVAGVTSYHFARTEYFIEHRFKDGYIAIFQNNFCGTSDQIAPPAIDDGDDIVYRRALLFLISGQLGKARTLLLPISSQSRIRHMRLHIHRLLDANLL
jgi:hypothetical protein